MSDSEKQYEAGAPGAGRGNSDEEQQPTENTAPQTTTTQTPKPGGVLGLLKRLEYIPPGCRWDPENPPAFNWARAMLFTFATTFTVANLYYNHPILNVFAEDFGVSFETASRVPTLMQAGYAAGLLFICPLGDIVRRRPLVLALVFVTANIWLGLCITGSFQVFEALSFLTALTTVTPQLMLPLVAELAPPKRKALMISIVFSGLFTGVLLARLLAGIMSEYTSWRNVYYLGFGMQYALLGLLFLFFPDYPSVNPDGVSYFKILYTIVAIPARQPLLVQMSLIGFLMSGTFVAFWTTLTFLLASPPFELSTLAIGLFALVGMPPFLLSPNLSSFLVARIGSHFTVAIAGLTAITGCFLGTFLGTFSLAGPILQGLIMDLGMIIMQTGCRTLLVTVEPSARNRVNTVFMVSNFCGMLMGTAVGNRLYAEGGWRYSGGAGIAFTGAAILVLFARGPYETGWVGWRGGWAIKKPQAAQEAPKPEAGASAGPTGPSSSEGEDVEKSAAVESMGKPQESAVDKETS